MPPLYGPRAPLCWTRKPLKTWIFPSESLIGSWTWTSRYDVRTTAARSSSSPSRSFATSNQWLAISRFETSAGFVAALTFVLSAPPSSRSSPRFCTRGDLSVSSLVATRGTLACMKPIVATITIDRPRQELFDLVCDLRNHEAWTDHMLVEWSGTPERVRVKSA